jgi:HAD superfamily hydrolase (TIGR01509 family)
MNYRGIIFDFNGVLIWDSHLHEQVWRQYALQLRGIPLTDEELAARFHGRVNKLCFEYLAGKEITGQELKEYIHERESLYRRLYLEQKPKMKLSPGAIELIDLLVGKRIPHTIATSSERTNLDFFFEQLHLAKWFDFNLVVHDDGSFPGKPAPDIYLKAAAQLGLEPKDCLVVEDALSGIQSAYSAGIGTIVALAPEERHGAMTQLQGVSRVISNLSELIL